MQTGLRLSRTLLVVGLLLASAMPGRSDRAPVSVDARLDRLMAASDQAAADSGDPAAIQPDLVGFLAGQIALGEGEAGPSVRVRLALDAEAREAIESMGIPTFGRLEGFASAIVPVRRLREVAAVPGVERMQAVPIPTPDLDVSRVETGSAGLEATFGARGRGVVVGSIDTGVDWRNPDFRKPDGTTRIKYLWSQDDACVGSPPPAPFHFGCLYTEAQINAALAGGPAIVAPDADGHGTHTLGTAAGNGRSTSNGQPAGRYVGMAPEADLIVVKTFPEPSDPNGCLTCYDLGAGLDFIDAKAGELSEPYVVKLSLGSQYGGHDGSDLTEMTIDALTGPGKPGKVVVVSAGNHRGHAIHVGGTVAAGQTNTHVLAIPLYTPLAGAFNDVVAWSLWYDHGDNLTVTIVDPPTAPCGSTTLTTSATTGQGFIATLTTSGTMIIDDTASPAANGARFFEMEIDDQSGAAPCRGAWQLRVRGNTITGSGRYDAWIWVSRFGASQIEGLWSAPQASRLISVPGTAFNATTVGAYVSKVSWPSIDGNTYLFVYSPSAVFGALAAFSSPGPTRDGRIKPDLVAPGTAIVSTLSADAQPTAQVALIVPDGRHDALPGTSMAAAHVVGAYAQILEREPHLDALELRGRLTGNARVDAFVSAPVPNNDWGYGKLDALAAARAGCTAEVCDAVDNDCDGAVDEGFDVGLACAEGVGACKADGVIRCAGAGAACDAVPGTPHPEVCNDIDDDCDGVADDGLEPLAAQVAVAPANLWPPNHRMTSVHADVVVSGGCLYAGSGASVRLVAVDSSEPDDAPGSGDGHTEGDIGSAGIGTDDFDVALRAERDAAGAGRIYTLRYEVTDSKGTSVAAVGHVLVPHDERLPDEPVTLMMEQSAAGTIASWDLVAGALLYSVIRGDVADLRDAGESIDLGPVVCIASELAGTSTSDRPDGEDPSPGHAWFYLAAFDDGWGGSGYGTMSVGKPRRPATGACP